MRVTSFELLLVVLGLSACPAPPSIEDEGGGGTGGDGDGDSEVSDDGPLIVCAPGETQCKDATTLEVCEPTGLGWEAVPCEGYEICDPDFMASEDADPIAVCLGPCEQLAGSPSSEGCSFYTTGMLQRSLPIGVDEPPDAIIIGNPQTVEATVEMRWVPEGTNQEQLDVMGGPVVIPPGASHVFELDPAITLYETDDVQTSLYRSGAVYHVVSNLPVVAYLHSPNQEQNTNASTLLLPENVLKGDYIIYNHGAYQAPNYFTVIAMENQTTVTWYPSVETAGNELPLPFVEAGKFGSQLLNRFDNMRIDTSKKFDLPKCMQDLSGTIIEADKPIWVISAVQGLRLPWCASVIIEGCPPVVDVACNAGGDFAMEQNLPLDFWGREYVGPHSPLRGGEDHHWRIYAGEDNVTVTVTPAQPNTPINLAKRGDWAELIVPAGTHLEFDGTGVFMPVQYVVGHYATDYINPDGFKIGSPAMTQMVPTAQFLDRYVFVTGIGYSEQYVQVTRQAGADAIELDGTTVTGWEAVGEWEIATVLIAEGPHEIVSVNPQTSFGILLYGYSPQESSTVNSAGVAYMGGMKAEVIFIP